MNEKRKLKSIFVGGLFGRFDYNIDFMLEGKRINEITIITAPNGYGKSTVLQIIDDFVSGNYYRLARKTFHQLILQANDGLGVMIERQDETHEEIEKNEFILKFSSLLNGKISNGFGEWSYKVEAADRNELEDEQGNQRRSDVSLNIDRFVDRVLGLRKVGLREWRDPNSGRTFSRDQIIVLYNERRTANAGRGEPTWLTELRRSLSVLYISANRLRIDQEYQAQRRSRSSEKVELISEIVLEQIRSFNQSYAEAGRRLEQDFPTRVIEALALGSKHSVTESEVAKLIEKVRNREGDYQRLGLLRDGQTASVKKFPEDKSALIVLNTYLQDIEKKLASLEDVVNRLKLFVETLNSMLLFKNLKLDPDAGIDVVGDDLKVIPLKSLSSGEQHLIVLLGELIFESINVTTVLLDEPEISFHPEWQEAFPNVLEKIVMLNGCMIVMATHSPTLIGDSWDSVVELADQVRN